ncbi:hypothetical protein ABZ816_34290 [Actinosynnema sp. NPDC047251]|uniref:Uncharacterized protein n=1 Tax=Saccharothrix espanaensis (strain ATCC 51144 / DSM 44229 / JCM 9112 / NBRC 15066 / NRRL 15764) TaxID=1179773 RepID=K0K1L2_SACES|nr:hypothetical protein [Saccharothrix espanaensis]CCH32231.1 hypothetical protein BN6_49620 [Saccharothrix espanaensis DSM 44229]
MSDDQPADEEKAPAAEPAEVKPEEAEPDGAPEQPEEDADTAKATATDPSKARHLHQNTRALENAVAALLGERGSVGNVFVANTIGLVEAGSPRGPGGHGSVPTGPIAPEALSSITATFVSPDNYRDLKERLRDNRILLLRAPSGWGRTATALHLLAQECARGVEKLSPDLDLRSPSTPVELTADHGYLLESLEIGQAAALSTFALEQWKRRLADTGARMVVLVAAHTPVRDREIGGFLVDGAARLDDRALVHSHFQGGLRRAGKPEQDLADFPEFAELVEEVVGRSLRAHDLAEFGRGLCLVVLGERELEDVRQRYAAHAESGFREWFDGLSDNDHRAFAIALAVFDGLPLATVAENATKLAKAIQAAEVPDSRDRTRKVFAVRTLSLAEQMAAEITTVVEDGDLGSLAVDVVRYRDPHRPRRVLQHIWLEYPEAHAVVRAWLRELGSSPDRDVRFRVGVAAGLLSLSEFEHTRRYVIERWADRNAAWERHAVLGALRLPAMQPEMQPLLARMIDQWLQGVKVTGRRVAAVAALGVLPIMTTAESLKRLRKAADTDTPRMVIAIADAITNLVVEHDKLDAVLGELIKWSVSTKPAVRATALICVVQLSVYLQVSEDGSTEPWPGLLWVAEDDTRTADRADRVVVGTRRVTRREAVVTLVARALEAQFYLHEMLDVFRRWVKTAQRDTTQRAPLGRLFADLVRTTGDAATIPFHLEDWARARNGPRDAVADLLAALDEKENRA